MASFININGPAKVTTLPDGKHNQNPRALVTITIAAAATIACIAAGNATIECRMVITTDGTLFFF